MLLRPITPADILSRYRYDRTTGRFYHREPPFAGDRADICAGRGYRKLNVMGRYLHANRVVWFLEHGDWPLRITHINGDHGDNRPDNLTVAQSKPKEDKRPAHSMLRSTRRRPVAPSKSEVKYIYQNPYTGEWFAKIIRGGKQICSPFVPTIAEAKILLDELLAKHPRQ